MGPGNRCRDRAGRARRYRSVIDSVICSGRGGGKTYAAMTEIHHWVVLGRRDVLVIFPNVNYLHWWTAEWNSRFPHAPMIDYATINNLLKLRGKFYAKVYVEDIDAYPEGIYDYRLRELRHSLRSPWNDEEMVFTASPNPLNARTHNKLTTRQQLMADRLAARRLQRHIDLVKAIASLEVRPHEEA